MMKVLAGFVFAAALTAVAVPSANAALYWTPFVSEENGSPPSVCSNWNEAAVGFSCTGPSCDNLRLLCETLPFGATLNAPDDYWSPWFSEENDDIFLLRHHTWYPYEEENMHVCHSTSQIAGFVSGIKCQGRRCDNVAIECTQAVKWNGSQNVYLNHTNCSWSGWYSEENTGNSGSVDFGFNRYITGVTCSGGYCDNMKFYVCSMSDPGF